jgi:hypothetical protein
MKKQTKLCLLEALRRYFLYLERNTNATVYLSLGLGYPSEYKQVVKDGYMLPNDKETPKILGWYRLTIKGRETLIKWIALGITKNDFKNFDFTGDWNLLD